MIRVCVQSLSVISFLSNLTWTHSHWLCWANNCSSQWRCPSRGDIGKQKKRTSVLFSNSRREAISLQGRILQTRSFAEKWVTDKFLIIVSANSQSQQSRRFISHLQRNFVIISYAMFRQTSRTDLINSVYPVKVSFCKETLRPCVNPEAFMRPWHQCFSPDDVFEGLFRHNPKERLS